MQHHNQEAETPPTLARTEQTPGIKEARGVLRDTVWHAEMISTPISISLVVARTSRAPVISNNPPSRLNLNNAPGEPIKRCRCSSSGPRSAPALHQDDGKPTASLKGHGHPDRHFPPQDAAHARAAGHAEESQDVN